jgi:hypothetical protein
VEETGECSEGRLNHSDGEALARLSGIWITSEGVDSPGGKNLRRDSVCGNVRTERIVAVTDYLMRCVEL